MATITLLVFFYIHFFVYRHLSDEICPHCSGKSPDSVNSFKTLLKTHSQDDLPDVNPLFSVSYPPPNYPVFMTLFLFSLLLLFFYFIPSDDLVLAGWGGTQWGVRGNMV